MCVCALRHTSHGSMEGAAIGEDDADVGHRERDEHYDDHHLDDHRKHDCDAQPQVRGHCKI